MVDQRKAPTKIKMIKYLIIIPPYIFSAYLWYSFKKYKRRIKLKSEELHTINGMKNAAIESIALKYRDMIHAVNYKDWDMSIEIRDCVIYLIINKDPVWIHQYHTKTSLIRRLLKAVLEIEEQNTRKLFLYHNRAIFSNEIEVDALSGADVTTLYKYQPDKAEQTT
jgi:hypothetical protein